MITCRAQAHGIILNLALPDDFAAELAARRLRLLRYPNPGTIIIPVNSINLGDHNAIGSISLEQSTLDDLVRRLQPRV